MFVGEIHNVLAFLKALGNAARRGCVSSGIKNLIGQCVRHLVVQILSRSKNLSSSAELYLFVTDGGVTYGA